MKVIYIKKNKREINNRVNNSHYATGKRKSLRECEFPRMEKVFISLYYLQMQLKKTIVVLKPIKDGFKN